MTNDELREDVMPVNAKQILTSVAVTVSLLAPRLSVAQPDPHQHDHPVPERLGTVNFETTCAAATKADFNRATALLHSFAFLAATNAFERVLSEDPTCGIAAWGIALSAWSNPFSGIKVGAPIEKGAAAVARAQKIGAKSQRERDYIAAVAELYKDAQTVDHPTRVAAYARAMAHVASTYPDDSEAQIFAALALIPTAPPTDKTFAKQLEAGAVLEKMFATAPDHPGLAHYIIHTYDVPPLAPRALDAAQRYAQIAPSAPHALHMPSHTFTRLGYWRESVQSNLASAAAAKKDGSTGEELHALDYQVYAYLQMGQDAAVGRIVAELPAIAARLTLPTAGGGAAPVSAGGYAASAIPARYALERGDWSRAASLQPLPVEGVAPQALAVTYFARAIGAARAASPGTTADDIAHLVALRDELTSKKDVYWAGQVEIQRQLASAWSSWAAGRRDEALSLAAQGADAEDATEKAAVSPGPLAPAREMLAEMLLEAGRASDARQAYEAVLKKEPRRFRAEFGAGLAAERAGDMEGASVHYRALVGNCEKADAPGRESLQHARAFLAKASASR
jgi:tetratricopeptide (TPR) repeat protein